MCSLSLPKENCGGGFSLHSLTEGEKRKKKRDIGVITAVRISRENCQRKPSSVTLLLTDAFTDETDKRFLSVPLDPCQSKTNGEIGVNAERINNNVGKLMLRM
ncbi:hypothetical protein BaRGS_00002856 [Batillaria attramentaria]|uniref:Uncharacterized protein n=1 Tax=Batillaria attramentaria TaxID=370345 RepID=A0ABD0M2K5_9CAEN